MKAAWKINVTAVENLVEAVRKVHAQLIHVSTDYIFDGKSGPYDEQPLKSDRLLRQDKIASENAVRTADISYAIVRTLVLYGCGIGVKSNFALWLIQNLREGNISALSKIKSGTRPM